MRPILGPLLVVSLGLLAPCVQPTAAAPAAGQRVAAGTPAQCEARRAVFDRGRIVGGEPARPGSAPWQAEFLSTPRYTKADRLYDATLEKGDACKIYLGTRADYELSHKCGGAYIGGGWVITAAHCVDNIPGFNGKAGNVLTDRNVRLGTQNLTIKDGIFAIDAVVIHQGYSQATKLDDIAVVRLTADRRLRALVAAKRLARVELMTPADRAFDAEEPLRVTGWGWMGQRAAEATVSRLASNGDIQRNPAELQQLGLNYLDDQICKREYGPMFGAGTLCAASLGDDGRIAMGKDSCQGDSGGPLTRSEQAGRRLLVGLVSGGKGCGAGKPAIYTRVSVYAAWVTAAKKAAVSGQVVRVKQPAG